jgi:hypothetical protein
MGARKVRDAAVILPLIGYLMLTPPFADIFAVDSRILGVPTVVVYVFSIWVGLIVIAWRLAVRLSPNEPPQPPEG